VRLTDAARAWAGSPLIVQRISEHVQPDAALMHRLDLAGIRPGRTVRPTAADGGLSLTARDGAALVFGPEVTDHIFVRPG
jgi:hypothetical protein